MNFLAHAYLSGDNPDILIGNMIADQIKGKQITAYSPEIRHGIYVHRQIDTFTDSHPVTREAMQVFRESAGKYAGPFLDVSYDHFLALDKVCEPECGWQKFSQECYRQIEMYASVLPPRFCTMFMYMKKEDWLYNYRYGWLIEKSFTRLKERAKYLTQDARIYEAFQKNYDRIGDSYNAFFPDLKAYVKSIL